MLFFLLLFLQDIRRIKELKEKPLIHRHTKCTTEKKEKEKEKEKNEFLA